MHADQIAAVRNLLQRFLQVLAQLLDADQVAGGIAESAVANPVRLLGRLLDHFYVVGLQPLEGAVEVFGGQQQRAVGALAITSATVRRSSSVRPGWRDAAGSR